MGISETLSGDFLGYAKQMPPLEIAALVASAGMIILGVRIAMAVDSSDMKIMAQQISEVVIILCFGVCSLIWACRTSPFVAALFGFMVLNVQRGIFYALMGCYTFGLTYPQHGNKDAWNYICITCSVVSLIVGFALIVLGCNH